ncbi:MAG: acetyl-CoA carboxylase biotin carboxyl carrier protein [Chloroflexota bacterium]
MNEPTVPASSGIRALADLCRRSGVEELEAEQEGWSLRLRLDPHALPPTEGMPQRADLEPPPGPLLLLSQWVGVFHRSAEQGADPLAREGQHVREGDIVGVVTAMQLQSDVRAEREGIIVRFLVDDDGAVEYGQPLLELT